MADVFHVLGVSHTETNDKYSGCPFTVGARNLIKGLVLDGNDVKHYCNHGSETEAEDIFVTDEGFLDVLGEDHLQQYHSSYKDENYVKLRQDFSIACAHHIRKNAEEGDFVLLSSDGVQDVMELLKGVPGLKIVETNIGYPDPIAPYRIFETNTWRSFWRGRADRILDVYRTLSLNGDHDHGHGHGHGHQPPMYFNANIMVDVNDPRRVFDTSIFPIVDIPLQEEVERDDYFLFLGRIVESKGILEAMHFTEIIDKKLIIAGAGRFEDEIPQFAGKMPKHVEFIGMADHNKRNDLLARAECLVAFTRYNEPYGYIVPEASAFKLPVITSDTGGFTETVAEGINGFTGGCMADWVEKVDQLDRLNREVIREHYEANFSLEALYPKYKSFWNRINKFEKEKDIAFTF